MPDCRSGHERRVVAAPAGRAEVRAVDDTGRRGRDGVEPVRHARRRRRREHVVHELVVARPAPVGGELSGLRGREREVGDVARLVAERREPVHLAAVDVVVGGEVAVLEIRLLVWQRPQRHGRAVGPDAVARPVGTRVEPEQVVVRAVLLDQEDNVLDRRPAGRHGKRLAVRRGRERDNDVRPPRGLAVVMDRQERDHDHREEDLGRRHDPSATGPRVHARPA